MSFKLIDLFCGAGGMSLGFVDPRFCGGFETVLAVDNDAAALETHKANFGGEAVCGNIETWLADAHVPAADVEAPAAASGASSSVVALLTPVAGAARESPAEPAIGTNGQATTGSARPSNLRLVQIGLAVMLGWLGATIIGLRRVRALS